MSPDGPLERILDRHTAKVQNREFLAFLDDVFSEGVNRCTHVFGRCWSGAPSTLVGQVPLILFRHVLEMVDAIHVLLLESATVPARLQLRSTFEGLLYLEFMLGEEKEIRVPAFVAGSYLWGLRHARRLRKGSGERRVFLEDTAPGYSSDPNPFSEIRVTEEEINRYEEFLRSDPIQPGYELFEKFKRERGKRPRTWYQAVNHEISSLRDLALHLGRGSDYVMYDLWSRSVHPDLLSVHFLMPGRGRPQRLRTLRDGERIGSTAVAAIRFLREGATMVLRDMRPEEVPRFSENWERDLTSRLREIGDEITIFDGGQAG